MVNAAYIAPSYRHSDGAAPVDTDGTVACACQPGAKPILSGSSPPALMGEPAVFVAVLTGMTLLPYQSTT